MSQTAHEPFDAVRRLLIVDDDTALARMLAWSFEDLGYEVLTAVDCGSARRLARAARPAHALIDCHLPDGDGHSLASELAAARPALQIVLMSADHDAGRHDAGSASGAQRFFAKPVYPAQLHRLFTTGATPMVPLL
ncbi:MAG: response regulator [Gammaproteobacteria bacterium]|nr:response regulator [Gammaproteobacteria bacterium]